MRGTAARPRPDAATMRHPYRQMDEVFYTIVNDAISGGCTVLVFVAALPGALAATHTFLVRGKVRACKRKTGTRHQTHVLAGAVPCPVWVCRNCFGKSLFSTSSCPFLATTT